MFFGFFLQDEVSNSKCFITMRNALKTTAESLVHSVITEHRGAAPAGMTDEAATQHGGGGHQQEVSSRWDTFTFCLESWNRTLRYKKITFLTKP